MNKAAPEDFGLQQCRYVIAYQGRCGRVQIGEYCDEHEGRKCVICGHQATHECAYAGQFVCGMLLCEHAKFQGKHEHVCVRKDLPQPATPTNFGLGG